MMMVKSWDSTFPKKLKLKNRYNHDHTTSEVLFDTSIYTEKTCDKQINNAHNLCKFLILTTWLENHLCCQVTLAFTSSTPSIKKYNSDSQLKTRINFFLNQVYAKMVLVIDLVYLNQYWYYWQRRKNLWSLIQALIVYQEALRIPCFLGEELLFEDWKVVVAVHPLGVHCRLPSSHLAISEKLENQLIPCLHVAMSKEKEKG